MDSIDDDVSINESVPVTMDALRMDSIDDDVSINESVPVTMDPDVEENQSNVKSSPDSSTSMRSKMTAVEQDYIDVDNSQFENLRSIDELPSAATQKKETTGKDLMKESLSLPYFSLPNPKYIEYTNEVQKNLKMPSLSNTSCAESSDSMTKNDELPSCVSILEEEGTKASQIGVSPSSNVCTDEKEDREIQPNNCEHKKIIFKRSPDNEIVIIDEPSPHGLQKFKERCLHATSNKGAKKPNINFSNEISMKNSVGVKCDRSSIASASDGVNREVWRSNLLDDIKKKKEHVFNKSKEIEIASEEHFEVIEENDQIVKDIGSIEVCAEENEKEDEEDEEERENEKEDEEDEEERENEKGDEGMKREKMRKGMKDENGVVMIDLADDDSSDSSCENSDEDDLKSFSNNNDADDESDSSDHDSCPNCSVEEDNLFESGVCFSLPSHQPGGGFAETYQDEAPEADSTCNINENSTIFVPYEVQTVKNSVEVPEVITLSSDSESIPVESLSFIPLSEIPFMNNPILPYENDAVTQYCSGVFPSTNDVSSFNSQSHISNEIIVENSPQNLPCNQQILDRSFDASGRNFANASRGLSVKRRRIISDDEEGILDKSDAAADNSHAVCKRQRTFVAEPLKPGVSKCSSVQIDNEEVDYSKPEEHKEASEKNRILRGFIEDEAELSGEEQSSDEDESELDGIESDDNHEDVPDNEILRDQIGHMHLKHMQDDDDRNLHKIMNNFVDEFDLVENGQRKKKFSWANKDRELKETGKGASSNSDDDDVEIIDPLEHQNKLEWKKKVDDNIQNEPAEVIEMRKRNLKAEIVFKHNVFVSDKKMDVPLNRKRGSLINNEGLKVKKVEEATGTKKLFFVKSDVQRPMCSKDSKLEDSFEEPKPF